MMLRLAHSLGYIAPSVTKSQRSRSDIPGLARYNIIRIVHFHMTTLAFFFLSLVLLTIRIIDFKIVAHLYRLFAT